MQEIKDLLTELTQGLSKEKKLSFIQTLGYNSYQEIEQLGDDDKALLISRLQGMKGKTWLVEHIKLSGSIYKITRSSRGEVLFSFKGLNEWIMRK